MEQETTKKYIMEMVEKINDNDVLQRIFNYVHAYFLSR